jgi:hypothetical protein
MGQPLPPLVMVYEEGRTFKMSGFLFAVVIPLFKIGDPEIRAKDSGGTEVKLDWGKYSIIVLPKKCNLLVTGSGKLGAWMKGYTEQEQKEQDSGETSPQGQLDPKSSNHPRNV